MRMYIIIFFSMVSIIATGQKNLERGIRLSAGKFYFPLEHLITEIPYHRTKYGGELGYRFNKHFEVSFALISHLSEKTRRDVRDYFGNLDIYEFRGVPFEETYSLYNFNIRFSPFYKAILKPKLQVGLSYLDGYNNFIKSIYPKPWGHELLYSNEFINFWTYNVGLNLDLELFKTFSISIMPSVFRDTRVGEFQPYLGATVNLFIPNKAFHWRTWVKKS